MIARAQSSTPPDFEGVIFTLAVFGTGVVALWVAVGMVMIWRKLARRAVNINQENGND